MKGYLQPLSEDFVYSSPERPRAGSFRWVQREEPGAGGAKVRSKVRPMEVKHVIPPKH